MNKEKGQPVKVTLLSHTHLPIKTVNLIWQISRDNKPLGSDIDVEDTELFEKVVSAGIPVGEMIDFVFLIENVSVALREQMVRHRVGVSVGDSVGMDFVPELGTSTFWAQTMRVIDMSDFDYDIPESLQGEDQSLALQAYTSHMLRCSMLYDTLKDLGVPTEDARNVIPLGARHRLVWKLNLSSLKHIIGKRACWIPQSGLWFPLIRGIIDELTNHVHPVFRNLAKPPCIKDDCFHSCIYKIENERRLDGTDPLPPCALWLNKELDVSEWNKKGNKRVWKFESSTDTKTRKHKWVHENDKNQTSRFESMNTKYSEFWKRSTVTGLSE